ncbi:MAG: hypothetical protein Q4E74_08125 [Ruminococcus sp.]|nr:hypothetical protein [Ruminococcus sp.]
MEIILDNLIRQLLEQMQKETALTEDEAERQKKRIEDKLIWEGYLNG